MPDDSRTDGPRTDVAPAPATGVGRSFIRMLAALSAPAALIGVGAVLLAQQQTNDAAALDDRALPQLVSAQRLVGDINALAGYAIQFQSISTVAERTTLQERIDGRNASINRHLSDLRRLTGEASPTQQRLATARDELLAGVADLSAATSEAVRSNDSLRVQLTRLRGETAQPAPGPAQASLRELAALAASAPSQLILRNIARQFDLAAQSAPADETTRRLVALTQGEDGVVALKSALLTSQQQQRFILRRLADVADQMAALSSALATEAENALTALRQSAAAGAVRLRWLLLGGVLLMAAAAVASARHLHRRVVVRLGALARMVETRLPRGAAGRSPGRNQGDELDRLALGVRSMQTTISEQEQQLARLTQTDSLTGLMNRTQFIAAAADALERTRNEAAPSALLLIDIDNMKSVNNLLGFAAGDRAIRRLGELLRLRCRDVHRLARLGGAEFGVLMPEITLSEAEVFARRLRQYIADDRAPPGEDALPPITVSIGVTQMVAGDRTLDDPLRRADDALRSAKAQGRDRVVFTPPPFVAHPPSSPDL